MNEIKNPLADQLGPTKRRMLGMDKANTYKYRCSHCQHEETLPEVVITEPSASGDCKPGHLPRLVCPICGGPFRAIGRNRLRAARSLSARFPFIAMRLHHRIQLIIMILTLAICGDRYHQQASLTTAHIQFTGAKYTESLPTTTALPAPSPLPVASPEPSSTPAPPDPSTVALPLDQYRTWMEEAHAVHPYSESVDVMWSVMLCESSGDPNAMDGYHVGLFQYEWATWSGDWNPYRDHPMLDPRAQIFATAKAWQDGNQYWWDCYE